MGYLFGVIGMVCLVWGGIAAILLGQFILAVVGLVLVLMSFFLLED